jgi:hypothetical protein
MFLPLILPLSPLTLHQRRQHKLQPHVALHLLRRLVPQGTPRPQAPNRHHSAHWRYRHLARLERAQGDLVGVQLLYYQGSGGDDGYEDELECADEDGDGDEYGYDDGGVGGWKGRGWIDFGCYVGGECNLLHFFV